MAQTILARVESNATATASGATLPMDVEVDAVDGWVEADWVEPGWVEEGGNKRLFVVDSNVSALQFAQLRPRNSIQRVAVKVTVDAVDQTSKLLAGSFQVSRNLRRSIQLGSFRFATIDGDSALGSILGLAAPASGRKPITVELVYQQDNGATFAVPLITGGIADQTETRSERGTIESLSLADRGRLFRDLRVTKIIPAGSGLTRARVAALLAAAAGETSVAIPPIPGRVNKPVELLEGNWISLAQAIADVAGWRLLWDADGTYTAVEGAAFERSAGVAKWLYTEADLVRSINGSAQPFVLRPAADAYTRVELRGSRQVLRDTCGLSTKSLRSTGFVDEVSPVYTFRQASVSGLVSDEGLSIITGSRIGSRTLNQITFRCRDVVTERVKQRALFNPTQWRYFHNTDGSIKTAGAGGFSDTWLLADEAEEIGHFYHLPKLLLVLQVTTERRFVSGVLRRVEKRTRSWYNPRRHIKSRATVSTAWETSTADSDWRDPGNGEGIVNKRDDFIQTEREVTDYSSTIDGFVREKKTRLFRYAKKEGGGLFLYGDGSESSDTQEVFRLVSERLESWNQITEELTTKQEINYGIDRRWLSSLNSTDFGSPPAIEVLEDIEPVRTNFETDVEFEAAKSASKFEQQEIEAECDASDLLAVRPERELPQAFVEWAENEDELQAMCDRLILLGMAPQLDYVVPINGRLREGDLVHVRNRQPGLSIDHLTKVLEVRHEGPIAGPKVSKVKALIVPDDDALG